MDTDRELVRDDPEATDAEAPPSFAEFFLAVVDAASETVMRRSVRPRLKLTPAGMLRGEVDVVKLEVPALSVSGLVVDRFVVRAERVRLVPGFPPRLRASPVRFKAVVSQQNVDRWTRTAHLPVRIRLTPDGIVTTTGLGGFRVSEIEAELDTVGPLIRLRPMRANLLGVSTPIVRLFRGYLPLPPLPRDARLESVDPSEGELSVGFRIEEIDEPLTPDIAARLRSVLVDRRRH